MGTKKGDILAACICDGSGFEWGETASGFVCEEVGRWFFQRVIPVVTKSHLQGERRARIRRSGYRLFSSIQKDLRTYGLENGVTAETSASVLILYRNEYYLFHIGGGRIYLLGRKTRLLTSIPKDGRHFNTSVDGMKKPNFRAGFYRKTEGFLVGSEGFFEKMPVTVMGQVLARAAGDSERIQRILREIGERQKLRKAKFNLSAVFMVRRGCR